MRLKDKRRIVCKFMKGSYVWDTRADLGMLAAYGDSDIEDVLRDYINGKFTLEPKKKAGKRG